MANNSNEVLISDSFTAIFTIRNKAFSKDVLIENEVNFLEISESSWDFCTEMFQAML